MGMHADLRQSQNVFDIVAVLYNHCENIGIGQKWDPRFSLVQACLEDDENARREEHDFRKKFNLELQDKFESSSADALQRGEGPVEIRHICDLYLELEDRMRRVGAYPRVASWVVLQLIDANLGKGANDLAELQKDCEIEPLNSNYSKFGFVFPKLSSQILIPENCDIENPQYSACTYLQNVTVVYDPITVIVDSTLSYGLRVAPLTIAMISPELQPTYFQLRSPPEGSAAQGVYWIEARDKQAYHEQVMALLRRADEEAKATIAVFPEAVGSDALVQHVQKHAEENPFKSLKLIVMGSYYEGDGASRLVSKCVLLDHTGQVICEQGKRTPFKISSTVPESLTRLYPHRGHREWIDPKSSQYMLLTPIGGIAVQICLDFLQDDVRSLLCRMGCRWFLVPSATRGLHGKFTTAMRRCGDESGAAGVVVNSKLIALWGNVDKLPDKDRRLVYRPFRRKPKLTAEEDEEDKAKFVLGDTIDPESMWLMSLQRAENYEETPADGEEPAQAEQAVQLAPNDDV